VNRIVMSGLLLQMRFDKRVLVLSPTMHDVREALHLARQDPLFHDETDSVHLANGRERITSLTGGWIRFEVLTDPRHLNPRADLDLVYVTTPAAGWTGDHYVELLPHLDRRSGEVVLG